MRPRTACTACRWAQSTELEVRKGWYERSKRQRRCVLIEHPQTLSCIFCMRNQLVCSLVQISQDISTIDNLNLSSHSQVSEPPLSSTRSQISTIDRGQYGDLMVQMPPMEACIEIVSAYFNYIHDPSHNLFHRPSTMSDLATGRLARPILLGILALAARFDIQLLQSSKSRKANCC